MILMSTPTSFFDQVWWILQDSWPLFLYGIKITIILAIIGTLVGFLLGLVFGGIRAIKVEERDRGIVKATKRVLHAIVGFYVWFFRGTPMMVQAVFFYYMLLPILNWSPLTAGCCIISANTGAYMAEIIRAGIQSVDKGQIEGARSLGMSDAQTMLSIVLPQAVKNSFPSIGNELIVNIKDSSVLNVIGVIEIYFQSSSIAGTYSFWMQTFFNTCLIYLFLTTIATWILAYIEKRLNQTKSSYPASASVPK
ncbi:MAG: amino acid ABC transporter permease [Longicatena sp.]